MYKLVQESIEVLQSNRLDNGMDKLARYIIRIDQSLTEKMEMIQEWFVDMTYHPNPEIPKGDCQLNPRGYRCQHSCD